MSVVGYRARNHPQQVSARGARPDVDDRATPWDVFETFNQRWQFTIDVAASEANAKVTRFWDEGADGLTQSWSGERVWCNPPYSDIEPWVVKAWAEMGSDRPPELVVMLLPANRTEQGWWQRRVESFRHGGSAFRTEFLPGRIRFLKPGQIETLPNERPPFGCVLLIWGPVEADAKGEQS